jgi:hypothetical protein
MSDLDFDPQTAMIGRPPVANEPLLASGDARLRQVVDEFTISARTREEYGIKEGETPYWLRNARQWESVEMKDRGDEFLDAADGARIPLKKGQPKTHGDLILGVIPQEVMDRQRAEEAAAMQRYLHDLGAEPTPRDPQGRPFERNRAALEARWEEEIRRNHEAALTGPASPTHGLSIEEAYRRIDARSTEREEAIYRSGGQRRASVRSLETDMGRGGEMTPRGRAMQHAMGDSGFPRNPNSPLAAAQRRGRGGE